MTQDGRYELKGGNQEKAARVPVSATVLSMAALVAKRAQAVADQVEAKLHSVMANSPSPPCEAISKVQEQYPPLFADLRTELDAIAGALDTIERALSRTEL